MPEKSTIKKFVAALQTGRTNTTRALEELWAARGTLDAAKLAVLPTIGLTPLEPWLRQELAARGLSEPELVHLDRWPDPEKRAVRAKLVSVVGDSRPVHFSWELHRGDNEDHEIQDPDATGDITIIFRSPRRKVAIGGLLLTFGDITVDV